MRCDPLTDYQPEKIAKQILDHFIVVIMGLNYEFEIDNTCNAYYGKVIYPKNFNCFIVKSEEKENFCTTNFTAILDYNKNGNLIGVELLILSPVFETITPSSRRN